jgi:3-dehydroquinate synthase
METISVRTKARSYDVKIGSGNLISARDREMFCTKAQKIAVITDDNVDKFYGDKVCSNLEKSGFSVSKFVFSHGESSKTLKTFGEICEFLAASRLTRSDAVLALGGGVTGDLAGFAAASYQRGIDFIQCPTSLLAMVDSSVGGKTAVDLPQGKNLVGAFFQPKTVICDTSALSTLPNEFLLDGLGEVIKYGATDDAGIFDKLEKMTPDEILCDAVDLVSTCVRIKRDYVEADEFDNGQRAILNFGHTLGHAIEKLSGFSGISHGIAVANGMVIITRLSEKLGYSEPGTADRIQNLIKKLGLHRDIPFSIEQMADASKNDKKRSGNDISLVFCRKIGKAEIIKMSESEFLRAATSL